MNNVNLRKSILIANLNAQMVQSNYSSHEITEEEFEVFKKSLDFELLVFEESQFNKFNEDLNKTIAQAFEKGIELGEDIQKAKLDRSKLTQITITDKNGHRRKVWVKRGENKTSTATVDKKSVDKVGSNQIKTQIDKVKQQLQDNAERKKKFKEKWAKHISEPFSSYSDDRHSLDTESLNIGDERRKLESKLKELGNKLDASVPEDSGDHELVGNNSKNFRNYYPKNKMFEINDDGYGDQRYKEDLENVFKELLPNSIIGKIIVSSNGLFAYGPNISSVTYNKQTNKVEIFNINYSQNGKISANVFSNEFDSNFKNGINPYKDFDSHSVDYYGFTGYKTRSEEGNSSFGISKKKHALKEIIEKQLKEQK